MTSTPLALFPTLEPSTPDVTAEEAFRAYRALAGVELPRCSPSILAAGPDAWEHHYGPRYRQARALRLREPRAYDDERYFVAHMPLLVITPHLLGTLTRLATLLTGRWREHITVEDVLWSHPVEVLWEHGIIPPDCYHRATTSLDGTTPARIAPQRVLADGDATGRIIPRVGRTPERQHPRADGSAA